MLNFKDLSLRRGSQLLFSGVNFIIHRGNKVGVTGANGCGKSSLFALLRGLLQADAGEVSLPPRLVIAHVAQETPAVDRAALDYVLDGDRELRDTQADLAAAELQGDGHRQAELHAHLDAIGGYTAASRGSRLMHGLGFQPGQENVPVREFSGGWRMRLNLAQALMCRSDLLLLDEPTNHLDLDAVIWLQDWLRAYTGTLLLISHDRDFLDDVADHIAHVENAAIELYSGNYSAFERRRAERLASRQAQYEKQQREMAAMQSFVDRFRAKATKARQAQSRLKALARMETIVPAHVDSPFHFHFREPEKLPNPLLTLDEAAAGYADRTILNDLALNLDPGARIGLLGPNGAGKSTLIKLLAGELPLLAGQRREAQELAVGYFAQHQLEQLRGDQTPLWHLQRLDPKASEQSLRDYVGGFGFVGDAALAPVAPFSGGEKARLVLALLVYARPNLLLLDEPTNHLDLEMRHALAMALQGFSGAVVVVSHDRHLLRLVADEFYLVVDGGARVFDGDLDDYRRWLEQRRALTDGPALPRGDSENSAEARKQRRRDEAERRRQLQPLRREVEKLEREMETLQGRRSDLEQQLADPVLYGEQHKDRLKELLREQGEVCGRLETVEEQWLTVSEELENALASD